MSKLLNSKKFVNSSLSSEVSRQLNNDRKSENSQVNLKNFEF